MHRVYGGIAAVVVESDGACWGERIRTSDWLIQNHRINIPTQKQQSGTGREGSRPPTTFSEE